MDATAFVHMALQHMQSQCKELYSLDDIGSTTWRPNCGASSQHPLPELNLKRVVLELSSKSELGSTPSSDVFHVLIDGSKHAAFKQQTVQRHLTGYFFPHLAGSVRPSSEEEAQQLLLRLEGHWKAAAIRIARKKGFGAAQLLEAVPLTIKEAELGILHIPRDEHVLQTYAVVRAHLRDGLAFPGLSELLEQEQPAHSESLIVGMVGELANYGTLGNLLRWLETQSNEHVNAETSARGAAAVLKLLAALHTAKGLAALHAHGMVHGDLKADNVMASASASGICYKVGDLGSSKVLDPLSCTAYMRCIHGTMGNISPEVIQEHYDHGCVEYQPADDVHSLGMVLAQLAAGSRSVLVDNELHACWDPAYAASSSNTPSRSSVQDAGRAADAASAGVQVASCSPSQPAREQSHALDAACQDGLLCFSQACSHSCQGDMAYSASAPTSRACAPAWGGELAPCERQVQESQQSDAEVQGSADGYELTESQAVFDSYCRLMRADPSRIKRCAQARLEHLFQRQPQQQGEHAAMAAVDVTDPMSAAAAVLAAQCCARERGLAALALRCLDTRSQRPTAAQAVSELEQLLAGDGWAQLMAVLPPGFQLPPYVEPESVWNKPAQKAADAEDGGSGSGSAHSSSVAVGCGVSDLSDSSASCSNSSGCVSDNPVSLGLPAGNGKAAWGCKPDATIAKAKAGRWGWSLLDRCADVASMVTCCAPLLERLAMFL